MKTNYFFIVCLMCTSFLFAQNNDFNNGAADGGLWSSAANWSLGTTPISTHTVRTANSAVSFVDANFTVLKLQNLNGTDSDRFVNSSAGGVLTIDPNNSAPANAIAIHNVSANGVKLGLRGRINIQNTPGTFSRINSVNNADNVIEFENTSILTLSTPLEVFKAGAATAGTDYLFNGKLEGTANLRLAANTTATFGNSVSNAGYTGEIVLLAGATLIVNTTDDVVFYDGLKIQVNGNNATATINGQNVFNSGITVGGSNTFNFNVNKNQSSMTNIIFQGGGTLNLVIDDAVTNISFANNLDNDWSTGTVNITGFKEGVIRFGTDNTALTTEQLTQIVADNGGDNLALDNNGFLVNKTTLSLSDFEIGTTNPIIQATVASNLLTFNTPQSNVKIVDLSGRVVFNKKSQNLSEIDIAFLSTGNYIAVFDDTIVERFIKN